MAPCGRYTIVGQVNMNEGSTCPRFGGRGSGFRIQVPEGSVLSLYLTMEATTGLPDSEFHD